MSWGSDAMRFKITPDGKLVARADTRGMGSPARHKRCGEVFDLQGVKVISQYADCSTFNCPGCDSLIDDRISLHIERL